jgi:hypothetical protein
MPSKRYEKRLVSFLTQPEIDAVLAAPERNTWAGRKDHTLLLVAVEKWITAFGDDRPAPRGQVTMFLENDAPTSPLAL